MQAQLIQEGNLFGIDDFSYSREDAESGNPYNTTFALYIRSGYFAGVSSCEYDIKEFRRFIAELKEMYNFSKTTVLFHEISYGSFAEFCMDRTGQLRITGEIYGDGKDHMLTFSFCVDQTSLKPFITELDNLLQRSNP